MIAQKSSQLFFVILPIILLLIVTISARTVNADMRPDDLRISQAGYYDLWTSELSMQMLEQDMHDHTEVYRLNRDRQVYRACKIDHEFYLAQTQASGIQATYQPIHRNKVKTYVRNTEYSGSTID